MSLHRITIPIFLAIILVVISSFPGSAAPVPHPQSKSDTSALEVRMMVKDRLAAYQKQREFDYRVQKPEGMSLWQRLVQLFWRKVDELFSNKAVSTGFKWLVWVASIFLLIFLVVRVVGADKVMLFVTGQKPRPLAFTAEEDIHGMDMDAEIASAESDGAFRRAVRLQYLRSLKILSERGRIQWAPSKTNIDYLYELGGGDAEKDFRRITRIFEYAWYGEMELDRGQYDRASSWFKDFNSSVTI